MKNIIIIAALFITQTAFAQKDSVAFFYRPEKVVVLINERNEAGTRLLDFMKHFGNEEGFRATSSDGAIDFVCGRGTFGSTCKFVFSPTSSVRIADRSLSAMTIVQDLGLPDNGAFTMSFASSMKDRFTVAITGDGRIEFFGSKKLGGN